MEKLESGLEQLGREEVVDMFGGVVEHSPALVAVRAPDGRYLYANAALGCIYGVGAGELLGRVDQDFMAPADAAALALKDQAVMASGQPTRSVDRFVVRGTSEVSLAAVRFPRLDKAGQIIGVGYFAIDLGINADHQDHTMLESAEQRIAELRQTVEDLKAENAFDSLTRAWNRARLEESIRQEMQRFLRYGHTASLVFLDVDYFKQINDTMGHAAGDNVLRQVAEIIRLHIRSTDLFARWGGDEFLLLLPNTDLTSARLLAEKIRAAMLKPEGADAVLISGSFGVANCESCEDWEEWVACADTAMYRAKRNGRNRVEVEYGHTAEPVAPNERGRNLVHLIWHSSYESGHPLIDRQHRALFEGANSMISAMMAQWPAKEIEEILDCLLEDVTRHFAAEEAILRALHFPELEEHARIHARLLAGAKALHQRFVQGEAVLGEAFHFMVYEVIAQHMLAEDRKFFALLRQPQPEHAPAGG